jgi:hypothetical protein
MSTETIAVENTEVLSDDEIVSREEWLIALNDLLKTGEGIDTLAR